MAIKGRETSDTNEPTAHALKYQLRNQTCTPDPALRRKIKKQRAT
jgi:hypothetical protein